jgi:hypothetical protein
MKIQKVGLRLTVTQLDGGVLCAHWFVAAAPRPRCGQGGKVFDQQQSSARDLDMGPPSPQMNLRQGGKLTIVHPCLDPGQMFVPIICPRLHQNDRPSIPQKEWVIRAASSLCSSSC